jgi:hypothetical protein
MRRGCRRRPSGPRRNRRDPARLIDQGHVDPLAIRDISWTFWEIRPFFCPECGLNYFSKDWDIYVLLDEGFYDCAVGICPNGHRHTLDD